MSLAHGHAAFAANEKGRPKCQEVRDRAYRPSREIMINSGRRPRQPFSSLTAKRLYVRPFGPYEMAVDPGSTVSFNIGDHLWQAEAIMIGPHGSIIAASPSTARAERVV